MNIKKYLAASIGVVLVGCAVAATFPGHPNVSAAYNATSEAIAQMQAAQSAHNYNMGGHAHRAIELLRSAQAEISASVGE